MKDTKIYTSLPGLRPRRLALGLKATNLADALGVSKQAWSYWESGATMPSSGYLPALAELLQCSIEDLYKDEEETRVAEGVGPYGETEARDDHDTD